MDAYPWACLVLNARCEITAQNPVAARVTGLDFRRDLPDPALRNIVAFAISPYAREHILNWEDVVTALVPTALREAVAGTNGRRAPPSVGAAVAELRSRDPEAMDRLAALWREAKPPVLASRITFPVVWRRDGGEVLAFHAVVSWLNYDMAWAMDWHPADAATWAWLANGS